ncbi:hypothetical protein [Massilia sp. BSC265]|uniref:hypothetical protein n=1 Tax=Massilia sp. BSC265 TaxID=1549812 RepID=UPI000A45F747|nr:hypothetical protein [Massilia sp. BSC265]
MMNDTGELAPVADATGKASGARRQRTDIRTRDLINQAVASIPTLGLQRAAEFLATMNVPAEVAVRVLVYPNRRRIN